jgi:hypothetical protein
MDASAKASSSSSSSSSADAEVRRRLASDGFGEHGSLAPAVHPQSLAPCDEVAGLEAAGLELANGLFCDLFLRFLEDVWRSQRPPPGGLGAMGFPPLFAAFKKEETERLLSHTTMP